MSFLAATVSSTDKCAIVFLFSSIFLLANASCFLRSVHSILCAYMHTCMHTCGLCTYCCLRIHERTCAHVWEMWVMCVCSCVYIQLSHVCGAHKEIHAHVCKRIFLICLYVCTYICLCVHVHTPLVHAQKNTWKHKFRHSFTHAHI